MENNPVISWRNNPQRRQFLGKTASLMAFTRVHTPPLGQEPFAPYYLGLLQIDNQRTIAQLVDIQPEQVYIGMQLQGCLRRQHRPNSSDLVEYTTKFRPLRK